MLAARLGVHAQLAFIESAERGAFDIYDLSPAHLPRARQLINRYQSLPMDLSDASLVILAEELGSGRILSTDQRDFGAYRWKNRKPLLLQSRRK